jgi:hypothetical protein
MFDHTINTEDFLTNRLVLCSTDCMGSLASFLSWIIHKGNDLLVVDGIEDDLNDILLSRSSAGALKMAVIFTFRGSKFPPVRKTQWP